MRRRPVGLPAHFIDERDPTVVYAETPAGTVWLERLDQARPRMKLFEHDRAAARSPGRDLKFARDIHAKDGIKGLKATEVFRDIDRDEPDPPPSIATAARELVDRMAGP